MKKEKKYYIFEMKLATLNILSIILLIIMILLTYIIGNITNTEINFILNNKTIELTFITYLLYIVLHEIIHSIAYVIYGANFKNITYGIHIEKGILCCLCKQNITRKNILNSLLFPFFYIGVVTYIIGFIINSPLLIILSILNIIGSSGDLIMFIYFLKLKNIEYSEFNNPIRFALYTDTDLSNQKPFGLKYIETTNDLKRDDLKKVRISKTSIVFFIFTFIFSIILILI